MLAVTAVVSRQPVGGTRDDVGGRIAAAIESYGPPTTSDTGLAAMGQSGVACRLMIVLAVAGLAIVPARWASASAPRQPPGATAAGASDGEFAGLVDIGGGRRLYLECRGRGSPTVVFESGSGNAGDIWSFLDEGSVEAPVLPAVARFTLVCAYDRPGTALLSGQPSRSDPVELPRSAGEIVADLHALLDAAGVPGPYVLVGHSLGGLLARLYAGTYSGEVAGFVSVDAAHEIIYEAFRELLTPEQYASLSGGLEFDIVAIAAEMRQARIAQPLRPMPMVVLEHSRDRGRFPNPLGFPPEYPFAALEVAFRAFQDDLAALVPGTPQVIATESEHYIQLSQPDLVIDSIRAVVDAVRRGDFRIGNGELADTGGASQILITIAFVLAGLGLGLRIISTFPQQHRRATPPVRTCRATNGGSLARRIVQVGQCSLTQALRFGAVMRRC